MLLPFQFQQIDPAANLLQKDFDNANFAIDYYRGFKLGLDSLASLGYGTTLNLFDTENDPLTYDDDRTPDGKDHWTEEIYQDKLKNMAKVMAEIGAEVSGNTPAIIGVCETENRKVLEDLVNQETLVEQDYGIIQFDSPDRRGIDVALLYKKKLFTPTHYKAKELLIYDDNDRCNVKKK